MSLTRYNLSNPRDKQRLLQYVRVLDGEYRVEIVKWRKRRSDRQNRYYWPCFVQPLADWLSAQWGRSVGADEAHALLKERFLRVAQCTASGEVVADSAGDPLMRTRSTTELNTADFNVYLDSCAAFILEWCGIVVPDPCDYHDSLLPHGAE